MTLAQVGHESAAHEAVQHVASGVGGGVGSGPWWVALIPLMPIVGVVLATLCAIFKVRSKAPAWLSLASLAAAFGLTLTMYLTIGDQAYTVKAFDWINFSIGGADGGRFIANFSFYIDQLTCLWMLFVTGLGVLIGLYASEYMAGDQGTGYCRFYVGFDLFVLAMTCLVMGDNLLLLFLGWEGVGLCSYLLIGYYYQKPSARDAAKKAFIVNRIGDLGLSLGLMLTFVYFGSVEYKEIFPAVEKFIGLAREGHYDQIPMLVQAIPLLLFVGAIGKSAQLPLYVWLPDAMEGPTPVSALIHAATMVTAGVYLVARFFPFFFASEHALMVVAWIGTLTAFFAATIGMAQFDIKRIMAYSTVSQLGYMFAGLGFLTAAGGASHVLTHAFFKALLFLACGAVMHGFAGQLDLRKLSGLQKIPGWRITGLTMLVGCLNLAGFPIITSGFFSKDMIMAQAFSTPGYAFLGGLLVLTAGMTAYYTFRVYFRVFLGPVQYEPGDEHHDHDEHFHPHAPGWAINLVLTVLAICTFAAIPLMLMGPHHGWVGGLIHNSTAGVEIGHAGAEHVAEGGFWSNPHQWMYIVSTCFGLMGIAIAWWLHLAGRTEAATARADKLLPAVGSIATWAQGKWYVDELYDFLIRKPLWVLGSIFALVDKLLVDGLVDLFGWVPRLIGSAVRPSQSGVLHGYALGMAGGIGVILLIVWIVLL